MTECSQCGVEITDTTKGNVCARCLVQLGIDLARVGAEPDGMAPGKVFLDDAAELGWTVPPCGEPFGDYVLLEEIARGGMGVVYKAHQASLDRIVAVKLLPFGALTSPSYVKRFRAEASAAARLQHPNIVMVHEVGVHQGQHYLVMNFIHGPPLSRLAAQGPLSAKQAAAYVKTVAEAVHHAHQHGILHRDLKPSNVLIDENDQPMVTDFGLAKRIDGESSLTLTGHVLGSPNYMPPEQASPDHGRVTPRTDVYGLGATLYHLLTGRPPFQATTLNEAIQQVLNTEPVSPRLMNPGVPRDLETICLKCLEKEPDRRYDTADAVAHDLGRFLNNRPIRARPVGVPGKLWRWARRNPVLASLGAAVGLLTAAVAIGVPIALYRINAERVLAETNATELRRNLYAADLKLGGKELADGYYGRARKLLDHYRPAPGQDDIRGWEWGVLRSQCPNQAMAKVDRIPSPVLRMDVSHDGAYLAVSGEGSTIRVYSTQDFETVGNFLPAGQYSEVRFAHRENLLAFLRRRTKAASGVRVVFWNADARHDAGGFDYPYHVSPMDFGPDDQKLLMGDARHVIVQCDREGRAIGKPIPLQSSTDLPTVIAGGDVFYSPDGTRIFACETDGMVRVFDSETSEEELAIKAHDEGITAMAISPDGEVLATAAGPKDKMIKLWDPGTGESLGELRGHTRYVRDLAFSPSPRTNLLASASADETIRLWDVATHSERRKLMGHNDEVTRLAWSPDGRYLYSGARDGEIYVWGLESPPPEPNPLTLVSGVRYFDASSNGSTVVAVRTNGAVCLCDLSINGEMSEVTALRTANIRVYFSADGTRLFAVNDKGEIRVWDIDAARVVRTVQVTDSTPQFVVRLPRNQLLVFDQNRTVRLWSETAGVENSWTSEGGTLFSIGGSADGSRLVEVRRWRSVRVSRLPDYQKQEWSFLGADLPGIVEPVGNLAVALSPAGRVLALGNAAGTLKLYNVEERRLIAERSGDTTRVRAIAFSIDGKRLATSGSATRAVKVWDPTTGKELVELPDAGDGPYVQLQFAGNRLIGCNEKGDLVVWTGLSNSGQF